MHPHQETAQPPMPAQQQAQPQPVYYVPVQQAQPAPVEAEPRWVEDLRTRSTGQSVALAFIALLLLGNLALTFYLFSVVHDAVQALHSLGG